MRITVDPWQCAAYYNGGNGTKNPFMPPEAFDRMDNRLAIIAGEPWSFSIEDYK